MGFYSGSKKYKKVKINITLDLENGDIFTQTDPGIDYKLLPELIEKIAKTLKARNFQLAKRID